ncbi:MAG: hypothetical protein K8I82_13160, partial [Anaerolineae bacterium]|nr:hypothetical protein [Anaerolineae bacterium]
GWWPRFALLTPETKYPAWKVTAEKPQEPTQLLDTLNQLNERLPAAQWPNPPEAKNVVLGTGVYATWERYSKALSHDLLTSEQVDESIFGTYGRLPTAALKVAMLLAALDWPEGSETLHIELPHLARAIDITERWRASAHRVIAKATQTQYHRTAERISKQIAKEGEKGTTARNIKKAMNDIESKKIDDMLNQMVQDGDVIATDSQNSNGGPKTTRYTLAKG